MDKLSLDLNLPMMGENSDNNNRKEEVGTNKENGFLLFGVRVITTETEGDGGNKCESKFDGCLSRDDYSLSPNTDPDLPITNNSIIDKLTQLSFGSPFFMNNNNEEGCIETIDNPIEGVSQEERFKMTRNTKNVHECYMEDDESYCSDGGGICPRKELRNGRLEIRGGEDWTYLDKERLGTSEDRVILTRILRELLSIESDGDNNGVNGDEDNNNSGDDNSGSGGDKNNKKDGHRDSEDRYEEGSGGGGKIKDLKTNSMGQPGFDYRYGYHAGSEYEYPVGQLQAPQIFHHENLIQNIQFKGEMDMSVKNRKDGKTFTIHLKKRLKRTRNDNSVFNKETYASICRITMCPRSSMMIPKFMQSSGVSLDIHH